MGEGAGRITLWGSVAVGVILGTVFANLVLGDEGALVRYLAGAGVAVVVTLGALVVIGRLRRDP